MGDKQVNQLDSNLRRQQTRIQGIKNKRNSGRASRSKLREEHIGDLLESFPYPLWLRGLEPVILSNKMLHLQGSGPFLIHHLLTGDRVGIPGWH